MTRTELIQAIRDIVNEKATDTGLVTEAEIIRDANRANREVYKRCLEWNLDPWLERSENFAYPVNGLSFAVVAGEVAPEFADDFSFAFSGSPIAKLGLVKIQEGADFYKIDPVDNAMDHADIEPAQGRSPLSGTRWFVEGQRIWLTPPPAGSPTLKVWFARSLLDLGTPLDQPLAGRLMDHHDLVALVAAQMIFKKDEMLRTPVDTDVTEGFIDLRRALSRSSEQRTRRIRRSSHY
jgi:hypothetical protein